MSLTKPVIQEFIDNYQFQEVRLVTPAKYRFEQLRNIKRESKRIDLIYFQKGVESIDLQIPFCLETLCDIVFSDVYPRNYLKDTLVGKISGYQDDLYILTGHKNYIEFGKKFYLEVIRV